MKAAVFNKYGSPDVIQIVDQEKPVLLSDEILIKVHASTVSSADIRIRGMNLVPIIPKWMTVIIKFVMKFITPKQPILGTELSGEVESVGRDVENFKPGDAVVAFPDLKMGAHAEYVCMKEGDLVFPKPKNIDFHQGAAIFFGGTAAIDYLKSKVSIQQGESILIVGAAGSVGSAAVQLAKYYGAEVTAVCSTQKMEAVKSLGADHLIDYTKKDFTKSTEKYDYIMDCAGVVSINKCYGVLKENGKLLLVVPLTYQLLLNKFRFWGNKREIVSGDTDVTRDKLETLLELAEGGGLKPLIDRVYPFEDIRDAHTYVEEGHKCGNVVVEMYSSSNKIKPE